jgi:hypothetical protein
MLANDALVPLIKSKNRDTSHFLSSCPFALSAYIKNEMGPYFHPRIFFRASSVFFPLGPSPGR